MRRLILASRSNAADVPPLPRPHRRPASRRHGRRWRIGAAALVLGMIAGLTGWSLQSGWLPAKAAALDIAVAQAGAHSGLALDNVLVTGRHHARPADLRAALGVVRGTPMLSLDPAAARRRLEDLPWIARASVTRDLPDLLRVHLVERRPMALWQRRGRLQVIARDGKPVRGTDPAHFGDLPLVVGAGAPAATPGLLRLMAAAPDLAKRVTAAVRVGERRWNVRFANGVDVQLPAQNATRTWTRLAEREARHGLLQRDIKVIDLRLPDRMVVRMAPGAEPQAASRHLGEQT